MYVCMYVCMHVCMYVSLSLYIYIYLYTYIYIFRLPSAVFSGAGGVSADGRGAGDCLGSPPGE